MEFLKSKIKGCRINSCQQIGLERIIKMELSRSVTPEVREETTNHIRLASTAFNTSKSAYSTSANTSEVEEIIENYNLYIKLWNNAANVFLCNQDDVILETMFRRPNKNEMKDEFFKIPEPKKISTENSDSQTNVLDQKDRFPVREIPQEYLDSLNEITLENLKKNNLLFNSYIDYWYSEHADNLSRESLLEKAEKWYTVHHTKLETALQNLLKKLDSFQNAEQLKHQGDLILSFGYMIDGSSKFLECEDYETGKTVRLLIDPKKSPQENAAEYYKNYKKAVTGSDELKHDIEIARKQIEKLDKQYEEIKNEKNPVKIEQLLRRDSTPAQKKEKNHPGLDYTINGWYILVGRDANENDELLRHHVRGDDLWLHVRDFPGGYVFVKAQKGKTVPLDILLDAGNLAVYYSKARKNTKVDLYYTHVKYLRRAKNGPKGLVIPTQEKNLCITPDKERLSRLDFLHQENL